MAVLGKPEHRSIAAAAITALAGVAVYAIFYAHRRPPGQSRKIIPSPRTTLLPHLSEDQVARTPYPPDVLPGARDVQTPYGSMRVFEWGPESGRKVLFVHGDGTPSPIFGPVAHRLVAQGCRVMMFDLWGRGYTDTPADSQHDSRLYSLQILHALTSSPIAWGASACFSIVGYSMGGSIVMDFFAHHSTMIESVILLAPGGLLRQLPVEYRSIWYWYPSLISQSAMRRLIGDLLGVEVTGPSFKSNDDVELSNQGFTPAGARQYQFDHHQGHVVSFLSTIQYGPLQYEKMIWEQAGDIIKRGASTRSANKSSWLGKKLLCICGEGDPVVVPSDVEEDLYKYMGGSGNFEFQIVPGGHGFPWTEGETVAASIFNFWGS